MKTSRKAAFFASMILTMWRRLTWLYVAAALPALLPGPASRALGDEGVSTPAIADDEAARIARIDDTVARWIEAVHAGDHVAASAPFNLQAMARRGVSDLPLVYQLTTKRLATVARMTHLPGRFFARKGKGTHLTTRRINDQYRALVRFRPTDWTVEYFDLLCSFDANGNPAFVDIYAHKTASWVSRALLEGAWTQTFRFTLDFDVPLDDPDRARSALRRQYDELSWRDAEALYEDLPQEARESKEVLAEWYGILRNQDPERAAAVAERFRELYPNEVAIDLARIEAITTATADATIASVDHIRRVLFDDPALDVVALNILGHASRFAEAHPYAVRVA